LGFTQELQAQVTYHIGSAGGTATNSYFPIYSCYVYNYSQQIYTAAELNAQGASGSQTITQIKFFYASGGTTTANWNNWTVYIGNTAQSTFANTSNWIPLGSMTQVYSGAISTVAGNWITITLSTPYVWNGSSNLVVAVDENVSGYSCTALWRSYSAGTNRGIMYYSDGTNPNPASPPAANIGPTSTIAQIQFVMTASAACSGTPNGGTSSGDITICSGSTANLSVSGATSGTGITYQWQEYNGSTYVNAVGGTGATTASYTTPALSATKIYRLAVTCSNSGITSYSTTATVSIGSCCNYTFLLTDSYGDGWNGASMQVRQGTTVIATLGSTFTSGTSQSNLVNLVSGTTYNLFYTAGGTYPSEVGIQIQSPSGTIYTLGAGGGTVGTQLTSFVGSCPAPCDYTVPYSGNNSITTCSGVICDHGGTGNYSTYANGYTVINSSIPGSLVRLTFNSFGLECCCDYVNVYNGAGTGGTLLFSGNCTTLPPVVTSITGPLTLQFTSDLSVVSTGFSATISCFAPPTPAYRANFISMSTGSTDWCPGETRNISVTVQNTGLNTWTNSGPDINIGVKWNTDADYFLRVDANNLAPNATGTYNFTVTAPLTSGTNNLSFDVVNEGSCWFASNGGACGPGNTVYVSPAQTINSGPTVSAGSNTSICSGGSATLNGSVSGGQGPPLPITVVISSSGYLDETSWTVTNSASQVVGSGGPYGLGSTNTITVNYTSPPLSFFLETQGSINDNVASYSIICNGVTIHSGAISGGQTTTIPNISCATVNSNPITYLWSPAIGLSNVNILNPVASPSSTQTFTLTATQSGCSASSQVTVTVNPPTAAPTGVTASPSTVCTPTTVQLNATSAGNTINWYTQPTGGSSLGSSASGANFAVAPGTTTTYYAEAAQAVPPGSQTFNYNGSFQTFTVPAGVTSIQVDAKGAQGGTGTNGTGGLGGRVQTTLTVTPGETLNIYVGGQGGSLNTGTPGYNGGGSGSGAYSSNIGGGGGASDIRSGGTALSNRIVVAGGGGGGAYNGLGEPGAAGGGLIGATAVAGGGSTGGGGGTQSSGGPGGVYVGWSSGTPGSLGTGGNGGSSTGGAGGGGGYYGGGGGSWNGGGGGSSFSNGTSTTHTQGFQSGNGQVIISWSGGTLCPSTRVPVTVTFGDNIPPTINCPSPITVSNMAGQCAATVNFISPNGSDNCPGASTILIGGIASGNSFPVGTTTNTYLVTANNGQTAQCSFTITVNDSAAPSAACQNVTVTLGVGGTATVSASQVNNGSVDNCGITGSSLSGTTSYTCANIGGTFTVTLQVNDAAGNTATCSATVSVNDANGNCCNAPQAICQSAPVVYLNGMGMATLTAAMVNNGSTADCGLQSLQVSPTSFTCAHVGNPQTVVLTVTDINNKTSSCQTSLSVQDNTPPSVTCKTHSVNLSGNTASITPSDVYDTGSDNCGTVNLQSVSPDSFGCNNVGSNTVTLTVNDGKGNTATCSATVNVNDATPPDIFCQNISVDLISSSVEISPSDVYDFGSDNCGTVNLVSVSPNTFTCPNTGTNTVVLTANDGNGNVSTCAATVSVTDVTSPTFTYCPENITVDADESCLAIVSWNDPTATDNCGVNVTHTGGSESGQYFSMGSSTISYTATDDSGLTAECSFTVTVQDVTPPTLACQPGEVAVYLSGTTATVAAEDVFWYGSDNCGYLYNDSVSPATFGCSDIGSSHTVTLTVHDGNGNSSTCSASVMVYDNEAPTAACQNISVDLDASGNVSISAGDINNDSSDNCGLDGVSIDVSDFDCDDVGTNTVTLTATDIYGNTSSCAATVEVNDNTAPSAICKSISVDLDENNSASIEGSDIDDGSDDACGLYGLTPEPNLFDCDDIGENTVTLTVYDLNGNSSACTATVTVVDTEDPVAVCQNISVTLDENGTVSISTEDIDNGSSDNCNFDLSLDPTDFTCANQGTNTVTLTATDGSGNTSTCSATVTVGLAYSASIGASGSTTLCEGESVDLDAGDYASYQWSANAGSSTDQTVTVSEAGTYSVTVTNENGCTSSAEITVVVNPLPTPEITADGATTFCEGESVGLDAGEYSSYEWNALGGNATTQTITATEGGTYSVTVTDTNGCTGEASFEVTVLSLPEISVSGTTSACVGDNIGFTASGGTGYAWSGPNDFTSTSATVTLNNAQTDQSGSYTVTVTNENGCTSEYEVAVFVNTLEGAAISGNTVVCLNDDLVLIASGGTTYEWSGPNGFSSSGATLYRPEADESMSGVYTVSISDGLGCTVVLSTTVSISGAGFNVSITGSTNACVNGNIVLSASASGAVSYVWIGPDGYSSNTASLTRTGVTLAMSGIYTVYATNAFGCIATATRQVTVNATTAIVTGTTNVCVNGTINLIASGGNSYLWSGPGGFNSNAHSINRTGANSTMSGVYSVTVSNSTGCTGTASIMVTVHSNPTATLTGTTSICSGGTITITAPAGAAGYAWSGPNGFTATGGPSLVRLNANSTMAGQYKVTVTNAGGCTASASRSVTVSAPTTANVTGATSVCSNANVLLTATTAGVAYSWTGSGGFTATTAAISAPPVAGAYLVTVTASTGCISTATRNVTIIAAPNAVITGNLNVCVGGTISLTAFGGSSYNWSGPGGYTRVGSSVLRTGATTAMSGTYTVTVTGSGGCKSTASVYVTVAACKNGEDEIAFETLFAYPNPTNGVTTITFTALKAEQMYLSVFAVDGKEVAVLFNGMTEAETAYEFVLDTNDLPSGTYYAMLKRADGATQQLKLMVIR